METLNFQKMTFLTFEIKEENKMIIETKDGWEGSRKEEYTNDST